MSRPTPRTSNVPLPSSAVRPTSRTPTRVPTRKRRHPKAPTLPPTPIKQSSTCMGHCDSFAFDQAGNRCWCDLACQFKGDCCADRTVYCVSNKTDAPTARGGDPKRTPTPGGGTQVTEPLGAPSCEGHCGLFSPSGKCYCDASCDLRNDCCTDVIAKCGVAVTQPVVHESDKNKK